MDTNTVSQDPKFLSVDIEIGQGAEIKPGQVAVVHYTGTLENGEKFDSSVDRNEPFSFVAGAGQVIKGWDIGLLGSEADDITPMKVGSKRRLIIPYQLAYGEAGIPQAGIGPKATLIFDVQLIRVQ